MHHLRIIPFLLILLFSFQIYGQSNNSFEPKIVFSSPTAYELSTVTSGTFTKVGSEVITIDCAATDMLGR